MKAFFKSLVLLVGLSLVAPFALAGGMSEEPVHGVILLDTDGDSGYVFVVTPTTATTFDNGTSAQGTVNYPHFFGKVDMHSIDADSLQKMTGKVSIIDSQTQQMICYIQYSFVNGGMPRASAVFDSTKIAHCDIDAESAESAMYFGNGGILFVSVYTY